METMKKRNEEEPSININGVRFKEYQNTANNINTYFTNTNVKSL
jgi:hypothetical protein